MKLRKSWLALLGTVVLVLFCMALPFAWFVLRDRQLDTAIWRTEPAADFLSAAGRENAVARELYVRRQQSNDLPYAQPTESATARDEVQPYLAALRNNKVLPDDFLDAAEELVAQATECTTSSESTGTTTYYFSQGPNKPYLRMTVTKYGTLTSLNGNLGLTEGFAPAEVAAAYRTMLGLASFTDWENAEPLGYGDPAPCYSAGAQLYLVANMDRGYFSMSVTSMAPETYAGL